MADIEITCAKCSATTTLSEFADASNLQCRSCGARIEKPGALAAAVAAHKEAEQASQAAPPPPTQSGLRLAKRKREYTKPEEGADDVLKSIVDTPADAAPQGEDGPLELRPEVIPDTKRSATPQSPVSSSSYWVVAWATCGTAGGFRPSI